MYNTGVNNMKSIYPRGVEVVGSAFIENNKGELLLVRSHKWGTKWIFPGGHIEPGETITEALLREGEEETGLKLEPVEIFTWGELIDPASFHRKAHLIYFDLHCKVIAGEVKLGERELGEHMWVTPEKAIQLELGEAYKKVIEEFIEYLKKKA